MSHAPDVYVKVKESAELRGMSEDEIVASLRGAKFRRVGGELTVNRADLEAALKRGIVPKVASSTEDRTADAAAFLGISLDGSTNSDNSTTESKPAPITDPLAPSFDPATEARTKEVAAALGLDLAPAPSSTTATADKPEQGRQSGAPVTVRANDDEGYRLGRPRRWGQR